MIRFPKPRRPLVAISISVALMVSAGPMAHATSGATISLRPSLGPPTVPFFVKGEGFGANEVVDISFDDSLIGTVTTLQMGTFRKSVRAPRSAVPGNHVVTATGETSGSTASASFLVRTNWPRFHFDPANTGNNPYENVLSPANVSGLEQKWAVPTAGGAAPDPIVSYGRVYVAPTDGVVRALDASTGTLLWSHDTGGTMTGTAPTAADGLIYVGNDEGIALALSAATGGLVWSRDLGSTVFGSPVVAYGKVYVQVDALEYALDASTGSTIWSGGQFTGLGSPTAAFGSVFNEAAFGCAVEGVDAVSGDFEWSATFCSEAFASVTVPAADGMVFDASVGVHGLDGETGSVRWGTNVFVGSSLLPPAVAKGVVYVSNAGSSGFLTAMDESTGHILWQTALADPSASSPAVANGVIYLGGDGGFLRAYAASGGTLLWTSVAASSDFDASPAVSDGVVYAATADGTVYAFGLP